MTRWGIVSTIKAPLADIQRFVAWHLEQGAAHLYLYLDDADAQIAAALDHPRITTRLTDDAWWAKRKGRPEKHQIRQCKNARHANNTADMDWLAHIDVDEFLIPARPICETLAALPAECLCARVRPIEALAPSAQTPPGETHFKAFHLDQRARQRAAEACFPTFGRHLSGGFLSHVAGKLFFRARTKGLDIRIHNVFLEGQQNPGMIELPDLPLGHFHAADWDHFIDRFHFRLERGSYRAELKPQVRSGAALSLHALLGAINRDDGLSGLRAFFDEICTARPELCRRLAAEGLLRSHEMALDDLRQTHFPAINPAS